MIINKSLNCPLKFAFPENHKNGRGLPALINQRDLQLGRGKSRPAGFIKTVNTPRRGPAVVPDSRQRGFMRSGQMHTPPPQPSVGACGYE